MRSARSLLISLLVVSSLPACVDGDDAVIGATASSGGAGGNAASGAGGAAGKASGGAAGGGGMAGKSGGAGLGGSGGSGTAGAAGAGGGSTTDPDLLAACSTFWTARCAEWKSCDAAALASMFGDEAACVKAEALACATTTLGPASKATVADVKACFAAYGALDCPGTLRFLHEHASRPAACALPAGTLAAGAPCVASSECSTSFCRKDPLGGGCGACATPVKNGAPCDVDADCVDGSACVVALIGGPGSGGSCTPYASKGEPCTVAACHADLACLGGVCNDRIADGAVCDPQEAGCGVLSGCNGAKNRCEPLSVAAMDGTCGEAAGGKQTLCPAGSWCRYEFQDALGRCVVTKKLGDACELDQECPFPATCGGGACRVATATVCEGGSGGAAGAGGSGGMAAFDHGAPSDVYPAPHPPLPQAKKGSGSVMSKPVVVPIFYPKDTLQPQFVDFLGKVSAGDYFTATVAEYGIAKPIIAPAITLSEAAPKQITDAQLRAFLASKLDGTHPEYAVPAGTQPLYTFFFPGSSTITIPGAGQGCSTFGGYHDTMILPDGTPVAYAVIPRCQGLDDTTAVTHELVEAFTDPIVGYPAWAGVEDSNVLWGIRGGGELGDLCEFFKSSTKTDAASGRLIQATWSNASAAGSHAPCVPWVGPFFAAAPVMNDDIAVAPLGITTKGVRLAVGETRTIEVDLFSDGPTGGDFTLAAFDLASQSGAPPYLQLTLDKAAGQNGEKVALTITRLAKDPSLGVEMFYMRAELNGARMSWLGAVGELSGRPTRMTNAALRGRLSSCAPPSCSRRAYPSSDSSRAAATRSRRPRTPGPAARGRRARAAPRPGRGASASASVARTPAAPRRRVARGTRVSAGRPRRAPAARARPAAEQRAKVAPAPAARAPAEAARRARAEAAARAVACRAPAEPGREARAAVLLPPTPAPSPPATRTARAE
jgi:hypothetical protein